MAASSVGLQRAVHCVAVTALGLLAGCSTPSVQMMPVAPAPVPVATPALEQFLADAAAQQKKGERELALSTLEKAARSYPASKEPWLRIAQLHFETANHGAAIVASQEALQRDARDTTARSIIAVSGLRVSATALNDLRQSDLVSPAVRTEAEVLARALRETLGDSVLVPKVVVPIVVAPPPAPTQQPARVSSPQPAVRPAASPSPISAPPPPVAPSQPVYARPSTPPPPSSSGSGGGSGNPFGALK